MRKLEMPYQETGCFPDFVLDYLQDHESLRPFYKYPVAIESFKQVMDDKANDNTNRKGLVDALNEQNKKYTGEFELVKQNIESLAKQNTFTITTGHQLCIGGSPLYFIYKVVSVLNLCTSLKAEYPDNNFVPVFWLASEDHGEGEITKINLFGKTLEWNHTEKGASGKRSTAPYKEINSALREMLGDDKNTVEILDLFEQSYSETNNLGEATRSYLYRLFGEHGLVVIDGDDKALKTEFSTIMKDELEHSSTIKNVSETANKLGENYKIQAHVRDINLFYLGEGFRERIVREGDNYTVLNTEITFSKEEIMEELEATPEKFSPNVLMRPLYEEKVLPNLAYIGGPGESAYWMQMQSNFEYHNINFPMVILRDSVQLVDSNSLKKLNKLGVDIQGVFKSIESLEQQYLAVNSESFSAEEHHRKLNDIFNELSGIVSHIDQSLSGSIEGERKKQLKGLENIEGKVNKAIKRKHDVELNQLRKVKEKLFPGGGLQERFESPIPYFSKYGAAFIPMLLENLDVSDKKFTVLVEEQIS